MVFWKKKRKKTVKTRKKRSVVEQNPPVIFKTETTAHGKKTDILNKTKQKQTEKYLEPRKEFLKSFKNLVYSRRPWDVWGDFIIMFACSLSNPLDKSHYDEREKRYLNIIKKYNKQEQSIFPELASLTVMALEENPEQDFLGSVFMELNLANKETQQYFTPYSVCQMMVSITEDNILERVKKDGYITIHDPCCGAGATLIAGIHEARRQMEKEKLNFQNHILVVAQDIDEIAALMCYIQLSLLGIAAYIKVGNTITNPISMDDSTKNYWFTPMYFSDVWMMRRLFHRSVFPTFGPI